MKEMSIIKPPIHRLTVCIQILQHPAAKLNYNETMEH